MLWLTPGGRPYHPCHPQPPNIRDRFQTGSRECHGHSPAALPSPRKYLSRAVGTRTMGCSSGGGPRHFGVLRPGAHRRREPARRQAAHPSESPENRRTPSKRYIRSESQLVAALTEAGLVVEAQALYAEAMEVHEWLRAAGPDGETAHTVLALLTADGDPAGLQVRHEGNQLLMTHQTCVLVARRR